MKTVVFLGPTLDVATANAVFDAHYKPPAASGDIAQAVASGATTIALVDGAFEDVPAVRHREILWALSLGVRVYGAASMGALRAAELESFGMCGIGFVFRAFLEGLLESDDEVAVAHGPEELGYPVVSQAMVNIRQTLDHAAAGAVIARSSKEALIGLAKAMFYKERSFEALLAAACGFVSDRELERLKAWLPHGAVDQKRLDAVEMLGVLKAESQTDHVAPAPRFSFTTTIYWEDLLRDCGITE